MNALTREELQGYLIAYKDMKEHIDAKIEILETHLKNLDDFSDRGDNPVIKDSKRCVVDEG